MSNWYTRPVFVSSTFKDVQSERDSLRDVVFGKIDEKLKGYQRRLEPIDLRWGVETVDTPEQESKELLVLQVCLDEIERCRPFLLVILGDRYGWTPPAQRMQAAIEKKGFTTTVQGKSVTALEIEYGVLDSPEQKKRSFFYFRTISNYEDMPLVTRAMYSDLHKGIVDSNVFSDKEKQVLSDLCVVRENGSLTQADSIRLEQLMAKDPLVEQGHMLLQTLKQRIQHNPELSNRVRSYEARWQATSSPGGHVVVPATWADMVSDDIWNELQQECQEGAKTIDTSWQGQERTALEEFVELRSRDFIGREAILKELETFAISPTQSNTWGLCLHGGPGTGKSALFAALVRKLQVEGVDQPKNKPKNIFERMGHIFNREQEKVSPGDCLLLAHAGGISLRAGNVDALLRRWIQELARFLKLKEDDPSKDLTILEEKIKLFSELLSRASIKIRVVCLIDALNQFERSAVARHLTWLPELWPKNARLITTCIAGSESEALGKRSGVGLKELARLDEREAEAIVKSICDRYHRTLHRDIIKCLLDKKKADNTPACANPLWLTIAVEQLNLLDEDDFIAADTLAGSPEQKLHTFMLQTVAEFPATIEDLYGVLFRRADERFGWRYGINWIAEMLEFIACTRFGLRETDLEALLCGIEAIKQAKENDADFAVEFSANFALQFAAVRLYLSAHLVQRDDLGLWDFTHVQGRKAAKNARFAEKNYHCQIASHLEGIASDDGLKTREIMWHYLHGDLKEKAGKYYGRSDLYVEEAGAATKILAEAVLEGEGKEVNAGLEWIGEVLARITDHKSVVWFCNKMDFALNGTLGNSSDVGTRISLLEKARVAHERLVADAPDFADYARDLSINYYMLGDLQHKQGNLPESLRYYQQSRTIGEELRQRAPDSAEYAQQLYATYIRLGDYQLELCNHPEAQRYYQHGLTIAEELHQRAPDSSEYAHHLYGSYIRLGELLLKLGHPFVEVLGYYLKCLQALRQCDSGSAEYAQNLSMTYEKLGNLYQHALLDKPLEALRYYQLCLTMREELRQRDPDSAEYARDLSGIYHRLGDLQLALGNHPEALRYYQQCLLIAEELGQLAPDSAEYARDLYVSYFKLGELQLKLAHLPEAQRYYQQCLQIAEELLQLAPNSAQFSRDLCACDHRLGDLQLALGNHSEALRYYQQGLPIVEELRQLAPDSAESARDLVVFYCKLAFIYEEQKKRHECIQYMALGKKAILYMKAHNMFIDPQTEEALKAMEELGI